MNKYIFVHALYDHLLFTLSSKTAWRSGKLKFFHCHVNCVGQIGIIPFFIVYGQTMHREVSHLMNKWFIYMYICI